MDNISILDCTLRDGGYLIDYQFTAEDTYIICLGLERAGFKMIEIGHGTGLRSSIAGKEKAAATDEEYLQAARTALIGSDAQFGMFFIPGIGTMEDLEMAAEYGMGFVRIGTNVTEIEQAKPYIEKAKALGMIVSSNLMKSYAVSIDDFIELAKRADKYGADIICVVDSAGGMFPEDVRKYVQRLKDVTDKWIGFHGHNNLQLAIANSIEAARAGASVIDSSLQGMGRSAGNAQTEILVMVFEKLGYFTGIDPYRAMDLGMRIVRPMMSKDQGVDDESIVAGIAQFHSSFSKMIEEVSKMYEIDPRMLILEVSEINRIKVTQELAEETAKRIKARTQNKIPIENIIIDMRFSVQKQDMSSIEQLQSVANELLSLSKKTGKDSVFSITLSNNGELKFPFIRKSPSMVIGNCEVGSIVEAEQFVHYLDGRVKWILLDESNHDLLNSNLEKQIKKSSFSWYSEDRALRMSVLALISQKYPKGIVLILSDQESLDIMIPSFKSRGIHAISAGDIVLFKNDKIMFKNINAIISFGLDYALGLDPAFFELTEKNIDIYAARPNAFPRAFWETAIARKCNIYRIDSRVGFATELDLVIGTHKLINMIGLIEIEGISVISGGFVASKGAIIVDSVVSPTKVIGVSDGYGGLLKQNEEVLYKDSIEKIRGYILKCLYNKSY